MKIFRLVLIKPSHYDDDGYVIQWLRSGIPSNTLAAVYGLAKDCGERKILGEDVELRITAIDETNTRIRPDKLMRMIERDGGHGAIGLVGVQSNQFPRAMDIARPFRDKGYPVCFGGFHASGVLAMLKEPTPELQEALDLGISLYAGESEGRFDEFLLDAFHDRLKPIYNYLDDLPSVDGVAPPYLPEGYVQRTVGGLSSFDAGRGCPFICSFCTIINVHGRKSRFRSPDDVERIVRDNAAQGIKRFFVTDDNFARNRNWEPIFDRLIELNEQQGLGIHMTLQVDTQCHRIPRFIEKAARAGTKRVFIGLESINPENLGSIDKKQNKITDYRKLLLEWKKHRVITDGGYILGFPGDTPESIARDIRILKKELPFDRVQFYCLTPMPGSKDHLDMKQRGEWMDPDLNKYELGHVCMEHPKMTKEEWHRAYLDAWKSFYADEHIETLMRRAYASRISPGKVLGSALVLSVFSGYDGIQPLEIGLVRKRARRDRRSGMPIENPLVFYPKFFLKDARLWLTLLARLPRFLLLRRKLKRDPEARNYTDEALTPVHDDELESMEMYTATDSAVAAVEVHKLKQSAKAARASAGSKKQRTTS